MYPCHCLVASHSTISESSRGPSDRVLCLADQCLIQPQSRASALYLLHYPTMATSRQELIARSISSAATITTRSQSDVSPTESTLDDYNYQTSKIVRIAIVSGVIVLVITGIVLFFKVGLNFLFHRSIQLTSRSPRGSDTIVAKDDRLQFNDNSRMNKGRMHMK